jgi:hypothetical protein
MLQVVGNTFSDVGMTVEHVLDLFRRSSTLFHGRHCLWCSLGGQKKKPKLNNLLTYTYPSGSQLTISGVSDRRVRGLFIGVDYMDQPEHRLYGCVNDATNMANFMKYSFHLNESRILVDRGSQNSNKPTRKNILSSIKWLTEGSKDGDLLFFHYSGHGTRIIDRSGDEIDGFDEVLVPNDFATSGYITDDQLHNVLVASVPKNATLVAVIDSCHSGTILDLPKRCISKNNAILQREQPRFIKGNIVCISASLDSQSAADVAERGDTPAYGALTQSLITVVKKHLLRASLSNILHHVTRDLKQREFSQIPCISSSSNIIFNSFYFGL